jgi:hypothetical protein
MDKSFCNYVELQMTGGGFTEAEEKALGDSASDPAAPKFVKRVPRFRSDLEAMELFFSFHPPTHLKSPAGSQQFSMPCMVLGMLQEPDSGAPLNLMLVSLSELVSGRGKSLIRV